MSEDNVVHVSFGEPGQLELPMPERDPHAAKKLDVFTAFIAVSMVSVTFDPQFEGVSVPEVYADEKALVLNFSHRFHVSDFDYDRDGVRSTLSFRGENFYCVVPWGAVTQLLCHEPRAIAVFDPCAPSEE